METSIEYQNHINIVKDLNLYSTLNKKQKENEKGFEEIYEKAKDADVKLDTAKDFLNDLSRREMYTLGNFEGLADSIDIDNLSDEGAYNLLVHRYEKYDWNNDGTTEIGAARVLMSIPKNMDDETKKIWVETLNTMGDDFMAIGVITMSLNDEYNKRRMAEHFSKMSDSEIAKMQESASFDIKSFIEETLSRPYNPKIITFMDILNKIDGIIDGSDGGKASTEMLASTHRLKESLLQAQKDIANGVMTVEKEIKIKQIAEQILATEEESGLAIAIKETTVAEEIEAVYKDIFTEDKLSYHAKHNDIFYPMPSSFSQEIEDLQTRIIREKYPDFLPMDEALEKYGFKADPNNPETKDQKAIREEANRQTIEDHGGQEAHDERSAFIRGIYRKYPNNLMDKFHNIPNAKERANVFNAAVYESLESGSNLQEAVGKANHTISFYLDNNELWTQRLQGSYDFFIGEDEKFLTPDMEDRNNEEIIYDGYKLDLRKYGFDRDIGTRRIYDDEAKMVTSIQNQLDYANFLIDNPEIVQKEFDNIVKKTLEERGYDYTKDHDIYKDYINPSKELIGPAELALTVFSKYKIFD